MVLCKAFPLALREGAREWYDGVSKLINKERPTVHEVSWRGIRWHSFKLACHYTSDLRASKNYLSLRPSKGYCLSVISKFYLTLRHVCRRFDHFLTPP